MLRGFDPGIRNAVGTRLRDDFRILGIEEQIELRLIEILFIRRGRRRLDAIRVVKQNAEIASKR